MAEGTAQYETADNGSSWTSWGPSQPTLARSARSIAQPTLLGQLTPQQPVADRACRAAAVPTACARCATSWSAAVGDGRRTRRQHDAGPPCRRPVLLRSGPTPSRRRFGRTGRGRDAGHSRRASASAPHLQRRRRWRWCPWGGGTSVVGGLSAIAAGVAPSSRWTSSQLDRLRQRRPRSP